MAIGAYITEVVIHLKLHLLCNLNVGDELLRRSFVAAFHTGSSGKLTSLNGASDGYFQSNAKCTGRCLWCSVFRKRERDFTTGKPMHFIAGGVIFTLLFILTIWGVVQYILRSA